MNENLKSAILLIHCPDKQGIVATITDFLNNNNGNIIELDQHVDHEEKIFYMRIEWDLEKFLIPAEKIGDYFQTLIGAKYNMKWNLYFSNNTPRIAIFVSQLSHCLFDILARYRSNEWQAEVPLIISNHEALRPVAEGFNIPFLYFLL